MADSIYTFDPVPANNTALDSIPYGPNQLYHNQIDNWFRALASKLAQRVDDLGGVNTVGGTANAITVTLASGITAYATGQLFWFKNTGGPNTTATTMNVNSIGIKEIRLQGDTALAGGELLDNGYYGLLYDTAYDGGDGGFVLLNPSTASVAAATTSAAGIVEQQFNAVYNIGFACSVGSSALTIALKDAEGNDPSSSSPVIIPFRNVTAATGTPSYLTVTAATSLVISSGSTMGFASGVAGRLWIVGFNDGGTFRLGAVNVRSGVNVMALRNGIYSSTAEGGAGGADSAQVIYTGTAVSSKAMVILGYIEATEATAGTWATAPSIVKVLAPGDALPCDTVAVKSTATGAVASCATNIPNDDTIPQNTEGDQIMTLSITPTSACNILVIEAIAELSPSATSNVGMPLFQDSTASALTSASVFQNAGWVVEPVLRHRMLAATTSSTTFNIRAGANTGTVTFNGVGGSRIYGGALNSQMSITEVMA